MEPAGDKFVNRAKLLSVDINYNVGDSLIAPDVTFLIFLSDRPVGFRQQDLNETLVRVGIRLFQNPIPA
jgi:hypothetical protein